MRAIRVHETGSPAVLRLETLPDPVPDARQVLVRIQAAGVNPVDTYIRAGAQGRQPTLPYTPGSDGAGTVEQVGLSVRGLSKGDRVYVIGTALGAGGGTYAELALCEAWQVFPLPERLTFAQGAAIGVPYATAFRALFQRAALRTDETVLVHGASGGVGIAALQLAHAFHATVIATAGSDRGTALALEQGASHVVNHHAPHADAQILALTVGRGVDVIIEMLANVNLDRDLTMLARGGRVVVVGNRGRIEIDPRQTMTRDAAILGMLLGNATREELVAIHAALGEGLAAGSLRPVVGGEIPLTEAPRAHEAVMAPGAHGKIVLIP
jgi:NADPH:quinone reductase